MRVITGCARGQKLKAPEGIDVRPTSDAVKEAMFSAVQFDIEGRTILDLFSGTGQLGIEALSRGAKLAYFVDNHRESISITRENIEKTGFTDKAIIKQMPNMSFLKSTDAVFDLAFLDPPYEHKLLQKTLPVLVEKMSENGIIVCEHEKGCRLPEEVGSMKIKKVYKHGKIEITIYIQKKVEDEESDISGQL